MIIDFLEPLIFLQCPSGQYFINCLIPTSLPTIIQFDSYWSKVSLSQVENTSFFSFLFSHNISFPEFYFLKPLSHFLYFSNILFLP